MIHRGTRMRCLLLSFSLGYQSPGEPEQRIPHASYYILHSVMEAVARHHHQNLAMIGRSLRRHGF